MGIFGGFKAKFTKDSSRKNQKKGEVGVVCTSYRVFSEFSDDQYAQPGSFKQPTASTSTNHSLSYQNGVKPQTSILKTPPTTSSTRIETSQVETITIKKSANDIRKVKAKSHYELTTFKKEEPKTERVKSVDDLTNVRIPPPPPERKPTPKTRKSVENVAQTATNDNESLAYEYPSYNEISLPRDASRGTTNLSLETEHYYIQPGKNNTEGIYDEPVYNQEESVEVFTVQNSEGAVLQSKTKKFKKEQGKRREEKVILKSTTSDINNLQTSTVNILKEEKITVSNSHETVTSSVSEQSAEKSSKATEGMTDYGAYFNQKATTLGYTTSQAASIFFQDDDDEYETQDPDANDHISHNKTSITIKEITDDDESRRISSVEC